MKRFYRFMFVTHIAHYAFGDFMTLGNAHQLVFHRRLNSKHVISRFQFDDKSV